MGSVSGLQRLVSGDIVLGEPLRWNVYDTHGVLLLSRGHVLHTTQQLDEILSRGLCAKSDEYAAAMRKPPPDRVSPFHLLEEAEKQLPVLISHKAQISDFPARMRHLAEKIEQACDLDQEAALAWMLVGGVRSYVICHSIHSAVLSELLAKFIGWPKEERLSLLCAALTMNLGMLTLQDQLYHQSTPLTDEQLRAVKEHPKASVAELEAGGVTDRLWLDAVLQHHEMPDGSGYPSALSGDRVGTGARILALTDKYATLVTGRAHRPGLLPNAALKDLFVKRGSKVDADLTSDLIKIIGIYPPGSFVRLVNGDIAIVTRPGKSAATPIVESVVGPFGAPLSVYVKHDTSREKFAVREAVSANKADVHIKRYMLWGHA